MTRTNPYIRFTIHYLRTQCLARLQAPLYHVLMSVRAAYVDRTWTVSQWRWDWTWRRTPTILARTRTHSTNKQYKAVSKTTANQIARRPWQVTWTVGQLTNKQKSVCWLLHFFWPGKCHKSAIHKMHLICGRLYRQILSLKRQYIVDLQNNTEAVNIKRDKTLFELDKWLLSGV